MISLCLKCWTIRSAEESQDLLDAFALVVEENPNAILVCCGRDVCDKNKELKDN